MASSGEMRSRVTKKGQVTVPSELRRKFHIEAGKTIEFESSQYGILLKPVHDIVDSAGALAKFANMETVEKDLLDSRKKPFR